METIENLLVLSYWRSDPCTGEFKMDGQVYCMTIEEGFDAQGKLQEWQWKMQAMGWILRQRTEWKAVMEREQQELALTKIDRRAVLEVYQPKRIGDFNESQLRWLRDMALVRLESAICRCGISDEAEKTLKDKLDALNRLQTALHKPTFDRLSSLAGRVAADLDDDRNFFCDDIYNV